MLVELRLFRPVKVFIFYFLFSLILTIKASAENEEKKLEILGENFSEVLKYADARMWSKASEELENVPNSAARTLISWLKLRAGDGTFSEYELFLKSNQDWPGLAFLKLQGEYKISGTVDLERLEKYFVNLKPQTGFGALRFAKLLMSANEPEKAKEIILASWLNHSFSSYDFKETQDIFGSFLQVHNAERMQNLLWDSRIDDSKQMFSLLDKNTRRLAEIRMRLQKTSSGVDALIAALPKNLKDDPGLAFDRLSYRREKGFYNSAEELLLSYSMGDSVLGRPYKWAEARQVYARRALRNGDLENAYLIASNHFMDSKSGKELSRLCDLEWLSGFISLSYLNRPYQAVKHFKKFLQLVQSPISKARGGYWLGRAYQKINELDKADYFYKQAGGFQTTFYGQLAAERGFSPVETNLFLRDIEYDWSNSIFLKNKLLRTAILLYYANRSVLADRFFNHLSEDLSLQEKFRLAQLSSDIGLTIGSLSIAKTAADSGEIMPKFYFPVILEAEEIDQARAPLINAIIRQESEFLSSAISQVGALGLMQIMPNTARQMAKKLGVEYDSHLLLSDKEYNIKIGSHFLKLMLKKFNNSKVLAISAYNAGPSKVNQWLKDFGDPREKGVDPLQWIELIPYPETRNYVMRVLEAEWIYENVLFEKNIKLDRGRREFSHDF